MSTGPWPAAMMHLLANIEEAVDATLNTHPVLTDYMIGVSVTSHDDHVARLYEEGWDFSRPDEGSTNR